MRSITEDILEWSEKYLEPKNKNLGDVPVCPYARMARLQNKYKIIECHEGDKFLDFVLEGIELIRSPEKQIVMVACDDIQYSSEELIAILHAYNLVFVPQDIYLMGFHPWADDEEEEVEFLDTGEWSLDNEFMMVLIQNFDELEKASDNLQKTGYYQHWPQDYYEGTVLKRQTYRRYRYGRNEKESS